MIEVDVADYLNITIKINITKSLNIMIEVDGTQNYI